MNDKYNNKRKITKETNKKQKSTNRKRLSNVVDYIKRQKISNAQYTFFIYVWENWRFLTNFSLDMRVQNNILHTTTTTNVNTINRKQFKNKVKGASPLLRFEHRSTLLIVKKWSFKQKMCQIPHPIDASVP